MKRNKTGKHHTEVMRLRSRRKGSNVFRKDKAILSIQFLVFVAFLYVVICFVPVLGDALPKLQLLPGAYADTIVTGPVSLTAAQCALIRDDFVELFMDEDSGEIQDCHSAVIALVWDQVIVRQYGIKSFDDLRRNKNVTSHGVYTNGTADVESDGDTWLVADAVISKILMRSVLGSYIDTTDPTRSFATIRADPYASRIVRVPASSELKVSMLEVVIVAALVAVWQGWSSN
jgi:hypothetical protein